MLLLLFALLLIDRTKNPNSREQRCTSTLGTPPDSYWVGQEGVNSKPSWQHIVCLRQITEYGKHDETLYV